MPDPSERNLGVQPLAAILAEHGLAAKDLVAVSTQQLTHKMVTRACKGRFLTKNAKSKVLSALNVAVPKGYVLSDLFHY
jgi:hypothetical protein